MTKTETSLATSFGRGLGAVAAYSVHATATTIAASGRAGKDIVAGARAGYEDNAQRLAALREANAAAYAAAKAKQIPLSFAEA